MKISARLDHHHCDCWTCFPPLESRFNGITRLKKSHLYNSTLQKTTCLLARCLLTDFCGMLVTLDSSVPVKIEDDWLSTDCGWTQTQSWSCTNITLIIILLRILYCLLFFCSNFNTIKNYANVCTHIKINAVTGCVFSCKRTWLQLKKSIKFNDSLSLSFYKNQLSLGGLEKKQKAN